MIEHRFAAGIAEIETAEDAVRELHAGCCEPMRSPRMEALTQTLERARVALDQLEDDPDEAAKVVQLLEDAGGQLGYLQVACCTPARTKLYTNALASLARAQRSLQRTLDIGH